MRAYLQKRDMGASMTIEPDRIEMEREPEYMPAIREWRITICGTDGATVTLQGSADEMRAIVHGLTKAAERLEAE